MKREQQAVIFENTGRDNAVLSLIDRLISSGFRRFAVVTEENTEGDPEFVRTCEEKGAAVLQFQPEVQALPLQTGLRYLRENCPEIQAVLTVDPYGRHSMEEILVVSDQLAGGGPEMILGLRDLSVRKNVTKKEKLAGKLMSLSFRLQTKQFCPDLCSGLRGIPRDLFDCVMQENGKGLTAMLSMQQSCGKKAGVKAVALEDRRQPEHEPTAGAQLKAAVLLFWHLICYTSASVISSILDLFLFWLFLQFLQDRVPSAILIATIIARCCSGLVNYLINRRFSFESKKKVGGELAKYTIVIVAKTFLSGQLVTWLNILPVPTVLLKALVDIGLFFVNYLVQKYWVFAQKNEDGEEEKKA